MSASDAFAPPRAELLEPPEPVPRQPWSAWLLQGAALVLASLTLRVLLAMFGLPMGLDHAPPELTWGRLAGQAVVVAGLIEMIAAVRRRARWPVVAGAIGIAIGIVAVAAQYAFELQLLGHVRNLNGLAFWLDRIAGRAWPALVGLPILLAWLWHLTMSNASRRWFRRARAVPPDDANRS